MYQRVTRTVLPFAADITGHTAGMVAAITVGMAAFAATEAGASTGDLAGGLRATRPAACPADATSPVPEVSAGAPSATGATAPSLRLAMTARGVPGKGGDVVEYRFTARPARTPLHDVTVTARLTCAPGDVRLTGDPTASAGQVTVGSRAVTWRLDPVTAPATATFTVRVRPGAHGGPLVGEISTTGPVSNCPALKAADTPVDAHCRVTLRLPGGNPPAPAAPAPAAPRADAVRPPARVHAPAAPPGVTMPKAPPAVPPANQGAPVAPQGAPAAPGAGAPLPVLPQAPGASPSPTVLTQLDRAPIVPVTQATPDAGAQEPVPPASALRPDDTSPGDLSGRVFAFLIGGVAFLLLATAIASSIIGARMRRDDTGWRIGDLLRGRSPRTEVRHRTPPPRVPETVRVPDRPRTPENPRTELTRPDLIGSDLVPADRRPGEELSPYVVSPPRTIVDVVRRTAEAGEPQPIHSGDTAVPRELPASRSVVDE